MIDTGVYHIKSLSTGRLYVGSAVSIKKRWKEHLRGLDSGNHHSRFLARSWAKNGPSDFEFKILLNCEKEDLILYEQILLDAYRPDYNTSPTAGSQLGYRHSEETKAKLKAARSKTVWSPMTGKAHTDEAKAKISKTKTGVRLGKRPAHVVEKVAISMRASKGALTEQQVRKIRLLKADGLSLMKIAIEVGCSFAAAADVSRGRTFKWVV